MIKSIYILVQSGRERSRNSTTKISRTRETRSEHRWAGNTKIYNSINISLLFFIILCWHSLVLWWAPHFCIFVYMEEIKSYYGMNLEQNLPFSWAPFKTGRKQGMVDGWKSKRVQPFKIERTNLKLENGAKKKSAINLFLQHFCTGRHLIYDVHCTVYSGNFTLNALWVILDNILWLSLFNTFVM